MSTHRNYILVLSILTIALLLGKLYALDTNGLSDIRRSIETERLEILDEDGTPRITLSVSPENEPTIKICDKKGRSQASIFSNKEGVSMSLGGHDSKAIIQARAARDGEAYIYLMQQTSVPNNYKHHMTLHLSNTGDLSVFVQGPSDEGYTIQLDGSGARTALGNLTKLGPRIESSVDTPTGKTSVDIIDQHGIVQKRLP
jgi:hypothetical protein